MGPPPFRSALLRGEDVRCPCKMSPVALFAHTRESESKSEVVSGKSRPPGCLREMNDSEVGRSARAPGRVPRAFRAFVRRAGDRRERVDGERGSARARVGRARATRAWIR